MAKKSLAEVIKEHRELGFDQAVIQIAYKNVDGDSSRIIDEIFRLQSDSAAFPVKPSNHQDEDAQLSKAIEASISEAKDKKISLQPLNPEQRVRKSGTPVGLKNIGNTCYFNSLLQTYFQNWSFVKAIIEYRMPDKYLKISDGQLQKKMQEEFNFKKHLASCRLVERLKELFCSMIASDRKYLDPTAVITSIVDDFGNDLIVGDQKDIGEFNLTFLSRIEEGLEEARKAMKMQPDDDSSEIHVDSPSKIFGFSEEKQLSCLRRSSIRLNDTSVIGQQFIGKIENNLYNTSENILQNEQQLFSLLFVNVKHRQLYKALEQVVIQHIDDYRNEKGEVIPVQKQCWIKEAPKTLFFQIDRVIYDKQKLTLEKVNDVFEFPKVFYIDPFLLKNKEEALKVQGKVRNLRKQKDQYEKALLKIQHFGEKEISLLDILAGATQFLSQQSKQMDVQVETDNPIYFPQLSSKIQSSNISILEEYRKQTEARIVKYKEQIEKIEKEIEKAYETIRSTPYHLYSILMHEGSAENGHYYSYILDLEKQVWRKYNDINISEEVEEQILKEAKGLNFTSAYYLVYAKQDVLLAGAPMRNYKLSQDEGYMTDVYSQFLSKPLKQKMRADNGMMYHEIEQYKMNSFATRVVDMYAKKFESCNEIFRNNNKQEKKKNMPPLLVSLPVYAKSVDEEEYKCLLIENCIMEYGPKEYNPVFEDLLNKKMNNFNDFKKPKRFFSNKAIEHSYIECWYLAIASQKLFKAIAAESYECIIGLLSQMINKPITEYFHWLSNILCKSIIVLLLIQAEKQASTNSDKSLQKLKLVAILFLQFINFEEERALNQNAYYWIAEINLTLPQEHREIVNTILQCLAKHERNFLLQQLFQKHVSKSIFPQIVSSVDVVDAKWNISRQENTVIACLLQAREGVKGKMESANNLYREMKKYPTALKKSDRDSLVKM